MRIALDIESDGLLDTLTKIHCVAIQDLDSSFSALYVEHNMEQLFNLLNTKVTEIVGHNIFYFDLPALKKIYNWKPTTHYIHDTYILAQLLFPDIKYQDEDKKHGFQGHVFTKKEIGSHSLKAWGQRIKCYKGDYTGGWESYNDEMGKYCIQDAITTKTLFHLLESRIPEFLTSRQAIELEYSIAPIIARQQAYGVLFDEEKAEQLVNKFLARQHELKWKLLEIFPGIYVNRGEFTPKRDNKTTGYRAGATFTRIALQEFNPGSTKQIVFRLIKHFNWNPEEFTEKGNAKMDEQIIDNLPFKELEPLKEYLVISKRLGQIGDGKQAWLKKIGEDGRIHGAIKQNGTITGRMSHHSPNMAQVVSSDSWYGKECRELFIVPNNKVMVGCDADALEMRCLSGYLHRLDRGRFMQSLLQGKKEDGTDPHSMNAQATDLPRDCAKQQFYADIYGAQNEKKGKIMMDHGISFEDYVDDFDKNLKSIQEWAKQKGIERTELYWSCWLAGKEYTKKFGDRLPELIKLKNQIHELVEKQGYFKGLDGRKLFMRSKHGELNTVLQSAGAIIMKKALYIADMDLQLSGLVPGINYEFILNVHDEIQIEVEKDEKTVDTVKKILENSIKKAGEFFNFPCPMKGNSQQGSNWSMTH